MRYIFVVKQTAGQKAHDNIDYGGKVNSSRWCSIVAA
jgi:hypothetical protein